MIQILTQNNQDPTNIVHPEVHTHMAIFRDNPVRRQKARECSARWRQNNPEKTEEHWIKFNEYYERKTREKRSLWKSLIKKLTKIVAYT